MFCFKDPEAVINYFKVKSDVNCEHYSGDVTVVINNLTDMPEMYNPNGCIIPDKCWFNKADLIKVVDGQDHLKCLEYTD